MFSFMPSKRHTQALGAPVGLLGNMAGRAVQGARGLLGGGQTQAAPAVEDGRAIPDYVKQQMPQAGMQAGMPGQPQQKRGLGGMLSGISNYLGRDDDQDGVSRGEQIALIGAMLRDDPAIGLAYQQRLDNKRAMTTQTRAEAEKAKAEEEKAKARKLELVSVADELGLAGRERASFLMNPDKWSEENLGNMYATVAGGNYRITPDGEVYFNDRDAEARIAVDAQNAAASRALEQQRIALSREEVNLRRNADARAQQEFESQQAERERLTQSGGTVLKPSADQMARIATGLPTVRQANAQLEELFQGGTRYSTGMRNVGASIAGALPFGIGDTAERVLGTDERDALIRAGKAYESTLLPILSGAAVTESEAQRTIKASIPQFGDSDTVLKLKAQHRANVEAVLDAMVTGRPVDLNALSASALTVEQAMEKPEKSAKGRQDDGETSSTKSVNLGGVIIEEID